MSKKRKNKRLLTKQQLDFLEWKLKGDTNVDAYLKAYPASKKWKRNTVYKRSSELMQVEHVRAEYERRLKEIEERVKKEAIIKKEEVIYTLKNVWNRSYETILEGNENRETVKLFMDSTKEINRMFGFYKETEMKEEETKTDDGENKVIIVDDM